MCSAPPFDVASIALVACVQCHHVTWRGYSGGGPCVTALLRPLQWQSLMLPVLPQSMISFLDAPVPFIVGVQHKTAEVRSRSGL